MKSKWFVFPAVWTILILPTFFVTGELLCKREFLKRSNVSAELQSDVLLPCNFDPVLLGSNKTADVAVVWKQINTTTHGLLEISQHGVERFWNNRNGRVMHFPKLSASGNFSILLKKVQSYDLGLYSCELHHGTNCSIGYQEIQLSQDQYTHQSIWIIVGALTGGLVLLAVLTTYLNANRRRNIIITETDYGSVEGPVAEPDRNDQVIENPIYDTSSRQETNNCLREEEGISSDTPVYATVQKGKKLNKP
ncbi:matrix remodeling-associated protein 8-like isoform X2 [Tachysurus vachellii]|uniref:matrix remodeling-associated protein 8-like isoform X2 n=1 Tax=Tachysurus vachellii TaxID=175792 RepID=UPI00296B1D6C|nr:matrix remodeling-associated protein 8-like isoform X2 [Tachysurus vachellii]